jgi:outer membrane protein assembly factor BamB
MRCLALVLAFGLSSLAGAADWPQFLGPNRDSGSPEKVGAWKDVPKAVWKKPVGEAHSSPVVSDGTVYAFYKPNGRDAEALAAFDAKTGNLKWEKSYDRAKFSTPFGSGPQGTPCVAGGKVFTFGSTGILTGWDAKTGEIAWTVDTLKEFKAKNLFFGMATSPIVEGKNVIVMVGGEGHGIVAFDTATGRPAWQATDDPASYSSPIATGGPAARQLVFLTGANLVGLSTTGDVAWTFPFKDQLNESSTTPVKTDGLVIGSSVTAGSVAVRFVGEKPEAAWRKEGLTCYFSTPVAVGKHLFMVNGGAFQRNPSIVLRCVETATGNTLWERKNIGRFHAALIRTGDDKLLMLDDNGNLTLLQPDTSEYKELARAKVCGQTWAHPALVDGRVYLRDDKELICLELK